jgi:hypothetical protein
MDTAPIKVLARGIGDMSTSELAARNEQTSYTSEKSQGLYAAIAGGAIVGVGIHMSKSWLIVIGIVVGWFGVSRMMRAGTTHNKFENEQMLKLAAELTAASTTTNTVA